MLTHQNSSGYLHRTGLDALAHGSQYALQQLQQRVGDHQNSQFRNQNGRHRQHPYNGAGSAGGRAMNGTVTSSPVRRRISRACDQCNQLRTKCDGQTPCAHCVEFGLGCEYIRQRKKRGKTSRKDLAQQAATAANGQKYPTDQSEGRSPNSQNGNSPSTSLHGENNVDLQQPQFSRSIGLATKGVEGGNQGRRASKVSPQTTPLKTLVEVPNEHHQPHMASRPESDQIGSPASLSIGGYPDIHGYKQSLDPHILNSNEQRSPFNDEQGPLSGQYAGLPYVMQTQNPSHYSGNTAGGFRLADSPLPEFHMGPDAASPGWMSLPSPSNQYQNHIPHQNFSNALRYPVLEPLIPHLGNIIPISIACDLLKLYFASSSSALIHPTSPYILGYVFRKHSILHQTKPRRCSPALLASTLWVVAQTSDASFLTTTPSSRGRVCQQLLELTVQLLKPLIHGPSARGEAPGFPSPVNNGVALGGLGVAMSSADRLTGETGTFGAAGALDDVVTYIHLATVVSASEYKGASLRWWNAAWSMARELKLGRELPRNPQMAGWQPNDIVNDVDAESEADDGVPSMSGMVTEQEREERRRIWWLLYTVDRHLALCYNRPLFLLDIECEGLLQPMNDTLWQAGEFYPGDSSIHITSLSDASRIRMKGPNFLCTGHSIFGYFLPLMTILGEIVDLHHAKNHPRFGVDFRSAQGWDDQTNEIVRQLNAYGESLKDFETRNQSDSDRGGDSGDQIEDISESRAEHNIGTSPVHSVHTVNSSTNLEADIQTRIVVAYGTHVMHVLHILLSGKWDPISLLDDDDLWISSQSFIDATSHAVSAAEAVNDILEYDPGLEFMPFFYGMYLLQGSFLLLLVADKLKTEASPNVVTACETIVRAHEACVVTLNTEYQRNFRKVMRSALAQVKGRITEEFSDEQLKRREVLALYRWTGDGTGIAL